MMGKAYLWAATGSALALASPLSAAPLSEEEGALLREEVTLLRARLAAVEARLGQGGPAPAAETAKPAGAAPATSIRWKGSPTFVSEDRSFKVKGRIQADMGYVGAPRGSSDRGFGFSNEFRRIRLGGEGKLGSGFGYKLELELSDNQVDLVDTFVTYEKGAWRVTLGNHNQFQSLDELIGDTTGSFMERAAFTDAFNFERRLGISGQYRHKDWLLQAGIFSDDVGALSNASDGPAGGDENDSFSIDGRIVYAPKIGGTQLHMGASAHLRTLNRLTEAGVRYRQRPYLHSSNSRILATPALRATREFNHGVELAGLRGRWHIAAEAHWLRASSAAADARLFGGYAEVGYFLTEGDSRSYKNGIFGADSPRAAFGKGGAGAIQLNLRYDYLDLDSGPIRGGKQEGYLAAIIWTPIEYLRFNLNYGYLAYSNVAIPGETNPGLHVAGARVELDF